MVQQEEADFFITANSYTEEREKLASAEEEADFFITANDYENDRAQRAAEAREKGQGFLATK